jgi:hypothetical protein
MRAGAVAAAPSVPLQFTILSEIKSGLYIFSTGGGHCSLKPSAVAQVASAEARGIYQMSSCAGPVAAAPSIPLQYIILFKINSRKYSTQWKSLLTQTFSCGPGGFCRGKGYISDVILCRPCGCSTIHSGPVHHLVRNKIKNIFNTVSRSLKTFSCGPGGFTICKGYI